VCASSKIQRVRDDYLRPSPQAKARVRRAEEDLPSGVAIDPDALIERLKVGGRRRGRRRSRRDRRGHASASTLRDPPPAPLCHRAEFGTVRFMSDESTRKIVRFRGLHRPRAGISTDAGLRREADSAHGARSAGGQALRVRHTRGRVTAGSE